MKFKETLTKMIMHEAFYFRETYPAYDVSSGWTAWSKTVEVVLALSSGIPSKTVAVVVTVLAWSKTVAVAVTEGIQI